MASLVPPLQIAALHTEHVPVSLVGLKYRQIAEILLALSESHEINFFFAALKTVVARSFLCWLLQQRRRADFRRGTLSRANGATWGVARSRC